MARHRDTGDEWPPRLRHFDPAEWPPEPDERAAHGAPRSARGAVLLAHGRWRRARLAALVKGSPEYGAELLRGLREAARMTQNPQRRS